MQNTARMVRAIRAEGLNRYISLLNAEPWLNSTTSTMTRLNRYISLLNAEPR